jgi:hypothetical protein
MFSKIIPRIKEFYFLPLVFMVPAKAFSGLHDEYVKNKNETLTQHTFCCIMGAHMGALSGAFLGLTWPISFPIFIGRYIDKNK